MFDIFFILVPFLSITHFHKKSKLIGFQLGLNYRKKKFESQIKKKHKILHSPSSTMIDEMMNSRVLHSKKLMKSNT
jgi:hypothetical protein